LDVIDDNYRIVTPNELVVGNHDSLVLFGSDAQQKLREVSKSLSSLLLNDNGDLEYLIHDIIVEIDNFQKNLIEKPRFIFLKSENSRRDAFIKKYNEILVYIDKIELLLKLQEVQIIKDSKLLEKIHELILDSSEKLEKAIAYGKDILLHREDRVLESDSLDDWYVRLTRRLEDLEISHTVAIQNQAQLKLMLENNAQLIDKIISTISGTIPIWRNQVTMLLGIEKINRNIEIQDKVSKITQAYINQGKKKLNKNSSKIIREIDIDKLLAANDKLKKTINDLYVVEKNDSSIRLELNNLLM